MRRRGLTLVEVLVAGGLGMLVLGLAWDTLSAGMRLWQLDLSRGSRQGQALALQSRLAHELASTTSDSVTVTPDGLAFLLPGAAVDPESGLPIWDRFVVYRFAGREVTRTERRHARLPGVTALALTADEVGSTPAGRVVLRDVERFHAALTGRMCEIQLGLVDTQDRHLAMCLQEVRR